MGSKKAAPRKRRAPAQRTKRIRRRQKGVAASDVVAGAAVINTMMAPLGRDAFTPHARDMTAWAADTTSTFDIPLAMKNANMSSIANDYGGSKLRYGLTLLKANVKRLMQGAAIKNVGGPLGVAAGLKAAVKITRANRLVPMKMRRYVRF